jgi:hypothetical protein
VAELMIDADAYRARPTIKCAKFRAVPRGISKVEG